MPGPTDRRWDHGLWSTSVILTLVPNSLKPKDEMTGRVVVGLGQHKVQLKRVNPSPSPTHSARESEWAKAEVVLHAASRCSRETELIRDTLNMAEGNGSNSAEMNQEVERDFNLTALVWQKILHWLNIQREARRWDDEVLWANTHCKGKQARAKVYRMAVAASVYVVWKERNQRIFKQIIRTPRMLVRKIVQEVHLRGRKWARLDQVFQFLNAYPV
uniref:Orf147a protein n=1 Tax=Solanum tuberosum TaxID=4113 RepID=M1DFJ6_SOLTU